MAGHYTNLHTPSIPSIKFSLSKRLRRASSCSDVFRSGAYLSILWITEVESPPPKLVNIAFIYWKGQTDEVQAILCLVPANVVDRDRRPGLEEIPRLSWRAWEYLKVIETFVPM